MDRTLIRGGIIVTPADLFRGDILIAGERIARIGPDLTDEQALVVDASSYHVFPGAIDAHVHVREPGGTQKEDFATGTR
ncbi:MAG: hypothetical protein M1482_06900, partial [Chloroflexi bacterium]|nr:hypothetical protein [Chloroflexota bacterium]